MRSSPWRTDTNSSLRKKSVQKWKEEPDSTEAWTRSPNAENKLKTSNICFPKNPDKTWSFKMNKVDPREFSMKNSLKQVKTEMKATPKEIALSTSDPKPLNSREMSILLNLKELTCSEKLQDSEMSKT
jgi:hypothetical protein